MFTRVYETVLHVPVDRVWKFHSSAEALRLLTPPGRSLEPISTDLTVREGAVHEMRFRQFGIPMVWRARLSDVDPPHGFTDIAEKSPFEYWRHRHEFLAQGDDTLLRDTLEFTLPFGSLGTLAAHLFILRDIDRLFAYRHEATRKALGP